MSKTASVENATALKEGPLNVFKYRWLFLGLSILFLVPGIYFIIANTMDPEIKAPLRLGIDFRGGTMLEYGFSKPINQSDVATIHTVFEDHGYTGSVIQIQQPRLGINKHAVEIGGATQETASQESAQKEPAAPASLPSAQGSKQTPAPASPKPAETKPATEAVTPADHTGEHKIVTIVSIRSKQLQGQDETSIRQELASKYGPITVLQKNSIGPALAKELLSNGMLALVMAYILIVGYLTFRFQFDYAVCAMAALVHDTIFLIGLFAMFGKLFHTEVDSLFITAILTVVGFSVHDTIVVFDRIRENSRLYFTKKVPFVTIVNMSVNQTMARSINTSLTALLTMLALYFFGGDTTKDFVLAIIIGIAAGTYSSIFNASVLLAMWRNRTVDQQAGGMPATA
ncbi:MAG: protein-export rane protein SecF [Vampirovibrio sp.]|jgi:preprotein translocase SecF subunit|nr:protein-export rane protein SecF [Vampirovibrio sp.]